MVIRAINYPAFKAERLIAKSVLIAIANSQFVKKLLQNLNKMQLQLWTVQADNAVLMDEVEIAPGAALSPFVTITSNIKIGKCFHANLYSYVEHDCVIGDYVTFAPGVKCNGNIHIRRPCLYWYRCCD